MTIETRHDVEHICLTDRELRSLVNEITTRHLQISAAEFARRYREGTLGDSLGASALAPLARFAGVLDEAA